MINKQYFLKYLNIPIIKNIGILAGGTAFSQLIGILALPILTRIYTPEDFTVLATFSSILALLTVVSCLRFEIAIPMPKMQEIAMQLFLLSLISVICITFLVSIILLLWEEYFNELTNSRLQGYYWLIPVGVFCAGFYKALQYWMTRAKKFKLVAKTRMMQALSGAAFQIGAGSFGLAPIGLLIGQILNSGAGVYGLLRDLIRSNKALLVSFKLHDLKKTFKRYERFPKVSTWEALFNSAGIQFPILIIASLLIGEEAGYLMLAMRLLSTPLGLIGGSVSQVYLSEAPDKHYQGELKAFTVKAVITLAKVGFLPLAAIGILSPYLVPLVFGEEWQRSGILISWMIPWFFIQFIVSPVSMSLHICGLQKVALILQFLGFCMRSGAVFVTATFFTEWTGEVYSLISFLFYLLYLFTILEILRRMD